LTSLCVTVVIVIVVGIDVNNCEDKKNSDIEKEFEIDNEDNSDYENYIYEEMIQIMLKHNAKYSKFNKKNVFEKICNNEKQRKSVASSPIPIPKQNVKWN
jgi:hypothetical protein